MPIVKGFYIMFSAEVMTNDGIIEPKVLADKFHTTLDEVAVFSGVAPTTLKKTDRVKSASAQAKLQCVVEIISKITPWTGSEQLAMAWYRNEPIPAFGGLTAENLVVQNKANIVRQYIQHLTLGGFA